MKKYSLTIKIFRHSQKALNDFFIFLQAVYNGIWLGLLNADSLQAIDEVYYDETRMYSSTAYNKKGLHMWEQEMIKEYFQNCRRLLLVGAGGGREVYALEKMGFNLESFECNHKLREFGNQLLEKEGLKSIISPLERDVCPVVNDGVCDGVIVGWGAYMLIQNSIRRTAFLRGICSQITYEAPILLSFFAREKDAWELKITALVGNFFRLLLGRALLETGDYMDRNYVHYFTESELALELQTANLNLIYYSAKPYGHAIAKIAFITD